MKLLFEMSSDKKVPLNFGSHQDRHWQKSPYAVVVHDFVLRM